MMNKFEYEFMTNQWEGAKGAAYNETFEYCRGFGWCVGFDHNGRVVNTRQGAERVRQYQIEKQNNNRIDVV